jgi:hypothetical protein
LIVVVRHLPLRGVEIVIDRASIVPLAALLPIADAHSPVLIAEGVAVAVVEKVVAAVVFTVVDLALEPKIDVTTNDDPDIDEIVPNAPPKPRPPKRPPNPPPALLDPLGAGIGRPLKPPLGGVPLPPPNPPPLPPPLPKPPVGQPDVLVTDTLVAVIAVGAVAVLAVALATETQSPFASEDRETAETLANLVDEAHATVDVPVLDLTFAVDPLTEAMVPDTTPKLAENCGRFGSGDLVVDTEPVGALELEPPPHAATARAVNARPAADSSRLREVEFRLLVMSLTSQCVDRGEPGGPGGRINPETDPDGDCHHDRAEGSGG